MSFSWDDLINRIQNPEDRVLFEEAANSAKANALRVAYIAIWLSCAESFKRKFKEASRFDHKAGKVCGGISKREQSQSSVDKYILTEANKYGFLSPSEFIELEKMYGLRNIFGHPYETAPQLIQVESAAALAVEYVLGRPLKLREGFLSRETKSICGDSRYLDHCYSAIEHYAKIVHSRSSEDCHHVFLENIWKESLPNLHDPTMAFLYWRVIWFSQAFLRCVDKSFFQNWNDVSILQTYPFASYIFLEQDLFHKLSQQAQDIAVSTVLEHVQNQPVAATYLQKLNDANMLTQRQSVRFEEALKQFSPPTLVSAGVLPRYYFQEIINQLKTGNWHNQEQGINAIRGLWAQGIGCLSEAQQKILGNNVLQAAEGNCFAALSLIADIRNGNESWPPAFIEGIIAECVINDQNQFRFKVRDASTAMQCIHVLSSQDASTLVQNILSRLANATQKGYCSNRQELLNAIDNAGLPELLPLRDAIANLNIQQNQEFLD